MQVTSLKLTNFRSFKSMDIIEFDKINVIVGANNAGKSSLIKALHFLQDGNTNNIFDIHIGSQRSNISIGLKNVSENNAWEVGEKFNISNLEIIFEANKERNGIGISYTLVSSNGNTNASSIRNIAPNHFIVPYLAKRKTVSYNEIVGTAQTLHVGNDFHFLPAKISRLSVPGFPKHIKYKDTCEKVLGFLVTSIPSEGGQKAGLYLPNGEALSIEQMGEGVPNIVALIADLALSEGKLFLIEEPENDLHPTALKALLELIIESSATNQFVISTHSNIVVRHLASVDNSKLFNVSKEPDSNPPLARVEVVEPTVEARLTILRDLGYSFSDFELWDGWLILEESSAERIIRDYLIPWFVPKLSRVRTLSTGGVDQIESTFEDFNRLVRFTHLESAYKDSAWVRVDGDNSGKKIITKLKEKYKSWSNDRFSNYSNEQFEQYYPAEFSDRVNICLSIIDKQKRRQAKKDLLHQVMGWLDEDELRAKKALKMSCAEIIADLNKIHNQLISI